jgi:peptide/nickel transport system permease protein
LKPTVRRIVTSILCLVVVIILNFLLPRMMPGDPVLMLTGIDEDAISQAQYEMYKEKLGLDRPLIEQFADYISDLSGGNLGYSYHYKDTVANIMAQRVPATLQVAIPTIIISSLCALFLGYITGYRKNSKLDTLLTSSFIVVHAVPSFLLAMIMVTVFAYHLGWFPLGGLSSIRVPDSAFLAFLDRLKHLVLPVTTLTIASVPGKYLLLRNITAAAKDDKYVIYARARGLSEKRIIFVHILRNTVQPFITMVGLNVGFIIAGSMIIENIFSINGMGTLIYQATSSRDFPTLQGCLFITALAVVIANIITDIICVAIDPKVRYGVYESD